MYAVIKTGGKQYRVKLGDKLRVESLKAEEGDTVSLDQVLMVGEGEDVIIGNPMISSASVSATVLSNGRSKKIKIIKFKRRKHYRRQMGHRQNYTELEITAIDGGSAGSQSSAKKASSSASTADKKAAAPSAASAAASQTAAAAATAAVATAATLKFMDAPSGEPDDLKKILGIGAVLEEKLNGMGIYHYSQIAEFTPTDIENINTHLNFPGRIERDEWIPQAKNLAGGGEVRALKYLDAPEGEKDNLKLISGVGPVLEDKLNGFGIFHFWQVAKFEQKDIELVNEALSFPGRIERDEWIAQAQNLADGGEPK